MPGDLVPKFIYLNLSIFRTYFRLGAMPVRLVRAVLPTALTIKFIRTTADFLIQFRGCRLCRKHVGRKNRSCGHHLLRGRNIRSSILRSGALLRFLDSGFVRRLFLFGHSSSQSPEPQFSPCENHSPVLSITIARACPTVKARRRICRRSNINMGKGNL